MNPKKSLKIEKYRKMEEIRTKTSSFSLKNPEKLVKNRPEN